MKFITQYKGLPKQIYILFMARTINSLGFFIFPFLTLFLSSRIGLSENTIGAFLFAASFVYIPGSIIGGKLADHFSRKYTYIFATLTANMIFFYCGFLGSSMLIPYLVIVAFFFNSIASTGSTAMLMDLTDPSNRQESFSILYMGMNIGVAIGPLVAGVLFEKYTSWIFWGDAISGFLAIALVLAFITDTKPTQEDYERILHSGRVEEAASQGSIVSILLQKPILLIFVVLCSILSFAYAQTGFTLPLQLSEYFGIGQGARYYGLLMSVNGIVVVLCTPIIVILTKKINPIINLAMAAGCYMIGFGMYAFSKNLNSFIIFAVVWTIGEILGATNTGVYIANRTPISHRARLQAVYEIIQGTGRAIGPMVIGFFLIGYSLEQSWLLIGSLCLISTIAFLLLLSYENAWTKKRELSCDEQQGY
jgi:MFS family permease